MAEYWLKTRPDAPAEGPFASAEVRRRAAAGEIAPQWLISTDNFAWHPAARVKGLFPSAGGATVESIDSAASAAQAPAPASAPAAPPAQSARRGGLPPAYPGKARVKSIEVAPAALTPPPPEDAPAQNSLPDMPAEILSDTDDHGDAAVITSRPAQPLPPSAPPRAALAPSLGYATPGVTGRGMVRPRGTTAFLIVAILMLFVGLVQAYGFYLNFNRPPSPVNMLLIVGATFAWLSLSIGALTLWAMWLGGVHQDMQVLTSGQYDVSPAKAAGFLFIPIFNIIWVILMPTKLARAANRQLEAASQPKISAGAVTACQFISVILPLVGLYPLTPLMYAITMRTIQRGFNRLAASQYA
ncbi:MAG: hypothetical protein QOE14_1125 [Humisphaera sp.]|nr:hypothetical protein [Humisphaera sp.]